MKLLITGAGGYIGSKVVVDALAQGHLVQAVDNFSESQVEKINGNKIANVDIRKLEGMDGLVKNCDAVLHLAAISDVDTGETDRELTYSTNVTGTANIAFLCHKYGKPLVFASSMAIFGTIEKFPIKENSPKTPLNFYGLTKLMDNSIISDFAKDGFPACSLIISNLYGTHKIGGKKIVKNVVLSKFVELAKEGKPLPVYKPGTQKRDFIHVSDVSRAFILAAEKLQGAENGNRVYNLASGKSYSVKDLAEMVSKKYNVEVELVENPRNEAVDEMFDVDVENIKNALGFETKGKIEENIE